MFTFPKKKSLISELLSRITISPVIPHTLVSLVLIIFTQERVRQMEIRNNIQLARTTAETVYWKFGNGEKCSPGSNRKPGFQEMDKERQRFLLENLLSIYSCLEETK